MHNRYSFELPDVTASSWCQRHQMKGNQESPTSSLNVPTISRLRSLFTLDGVNMNKALKRGIAAVKGRRSSS